MEDKQEKAEKELFALYKKTKDPEIKKEITMQYLYIARTTATKLYDLYSTTMQMEDAVNEGVVAIIKGIDMYDPDKNIKFSTYITTRVRGAMLDYVRKQEWMPRGFYKQLGIIESACEDMKRELGRTPTVDELAKHLGIEKKRCQRIISMKNRRNIQSLDFLLENQNTSNGLQITNNDAQVQPEEACLWEEDMRVLAEGIAQLNEKEQKTLALHYMEGLKMEQVGRVIGVSQPRASQIHTIALRKLRHFIETKNGNLFTVENDLKAFSAAATIVLFFIYLLFTKILSLFLDPLAISSFPI